MTTFLTLEEAAAMIRVRPSTIRTYVREGKLPGKRVTGGKTLLFDPSAVMALLSDAREQVAQVAQAEEQDQTQGNQTQGKMPSARELLRMTREQRRPYLEASARAAAPIYAADLARPEAERELTADLETGDIYDGDYAQPSPIALPPITLPPIALLGTEATGNA